MGIPGVLVDLNDPESGETLNSSGHLSPDELTLVYAPSRRAAGSAYRAESLLGVEVAMSRVKRLPGY